jgi:dTDP-4-amino-4,6-dideoxygalactose transaminase
MRATSGSPSPPAGRGPGGGVVRNAGSFGTGCFSLYATKNLTAGEGGVITTNDAALAQRLRRLRSHGEADRYESIEVGYNYRITEVGAALALSQLEGLIEANQRRRENAAFLTGHLQGVQTPETPADLVTHVWHQYTVRVAGGRDALQRHLRERGIEAMVYYPKTLPAHKLYRDLGYDDDGFPMARRLANEVLSLPVHPGLSLADLRFIVASVNEWTAARRSVKATPR